MNEYKSTRRWIGAPLTNREFDPLVTGRATYSDDIELAQPLYVVFARSQVAGAALSGVDTADAAQMKGVVAVHTAADMLAIGKLSVNPVLPVHRELPYPILARQRVHAVGQPVVAVVAQSQGLAQDAAEAVQIEYEQTDSCIDTVDGEPIASQRWCVNNPTEQFERADHVVECALDFPRLAPTPIEPRTIAIKYDASSESVVVWHATQTPHRTRSELAAMLHIDPARIHVISRYVGGAFGMKASLYPEEVFAVWAALTHQANVKWTASRSEDFLAATHGRGISSRGRLAIARDGTFLALQARVRAPTGHWLPNSGLITAWNSARVLPAGYQIASVDIETVALPVDRAPMGIYRGAGRGEANCLMERLVDKAARICGMSPVAIREHNLLSTDQLPCRTPTGNRLDSGNYPFALRQLCERADLAAMLDWRDRFRSDGYLAGVGMAFYLEPSGSGWESARIDWLANGRVVVASGGSSQGHGRETALAQIAADALGVDIDAVQVVCGDTRLCPAGIGALASRSTAIAGSAVLQACEQLTRRQEDGESLPMTTTVQYENDGQAWGYGCYLVALNIDAETGSVKIERAACIDDAGQIVNPAQVDGQIKGAFAQGLGEALMEQIIYDDNNELLSGSLLDYAVPRAVDVPMLEVFKLQTKSPFNLLGAKGIGEAGTIGAPAAVLNAAIDALSPLGITDLNMPLTAEKLWQAIRQATTDRE